MPHPVALPDRALFFFLDDQGRHPRGGEIEPGLEGDDFLGTGRLAQAALDAGILDEAQRRPIWAEARSGIAFVDEPSGSRTGLGSGLTV